MNKQFIKLSATTIVSSLLFSGCMMKMQNPYGDFENQAKGMNSSNEYAQSYFMPYKVNCNDRIVNKDEKYYACLLNDYIDGTIERSNKKIRTYVSSSDVKDGIEMMMAVGQSEEKARATYKKDVQGKYYTEQDAGIVMPEDATISELGPNMESVAVIYDIKAPTQKEREEKALKKYNELVSAFTNIFTPYYGKNWIQPKKEVTNKQMNQQMDKDLEIMKSQRAEFQKRGLDTSAIDKNIQTRSQMRNIANNTNEYSNNMMNNKLVKSYKVNSIETQGKSLVYEINLIDLKPMTGQDIIQIKVMLATKKLVIMNKNSPFGKSMGNNMMPKWAK